jgi:peptidyl-prolyl cis-trans isomerase SurA
MNHLLSGAIALFLIAVPFFSSAEVTDRIVAIVNDEIITLREVEKFVTVETKSRYSSVNEYVRNMQLRDKLDFFIEGLLINQQAKRLKIDVVDKEVEGTIENIKKQNLISENELKEQLKRENVSYKEFTEGIKRSLVRSKVLARSVSQEMRVDEKTLKEYYDSHPKDFSEEEYKLQHIFVSGQRKDAAKRAQAAFALLQKSSAFDDVAKEYSDEPSKGEGGDIGFVKTSELIPALKQGINLLLPGSHSNVIQTSYGYHILKLNEVKRGEAAPFEEMKGKIQEKLYQSESEKRYKAYIAKLKSSSYIEVKI